jgi:pimeloyl-ACP methyl ester carboxylesterase
MSLVRALRASAVALAILVVATGCTPTTAPTPHATPDGFDAYFAQQLDWANCGTGVECTTVRAPMDWDDASTPEIELAVSRTTPTEGGLGSILVNPGGPGASGYDFVRDSIGYVASADLLDNFSFVGWDPRGVGRSSAVTCLDAEATDELLFGQWDNAYDTEAWIVELETAEAGFVAACEKNTGELLGHIDSVSTAHDMELLRALLGEEKLNYLGYSYGTYYGALYAELFPERVGRLVLDGALDPTINAIDWFSVQMAGFDSAMNAYLESCLGGGSCPFSGTVAAAGAQFTDLLDTIDDRGLTADDGRTLDSATLGFAVAAALYSQRNWPTLSQMFVEIDGGDAGTAFAFADSYYGRGSDGEYDSNSFEAYTAVLCLDDNFQTDDYTVREGLNRIRDAAPLVGGYFAFDDYGHVEAACTAWPYPPADKPSEFDAAGAAPILVIGTTNDPATPYAWAQSLAGQLESGVLVTFNGEGHTAYGNGNRCIQSTVDAYFLDGTVPSADPDC